MGDVIQFPRRPTCFLCKHYTADSHCAVDGEHIDSEVYAARDCEDYEVTDG